MNIKQLENGVRLVYSMRPNAHSVSLGYWVRAGSFDEEQAYSGISHFLEHMVFKGTKTRTARRIATEIEDVGGYLNAYTSREATAYYVRVLEKHVDVAMDILTDMLINPTFLDEEFERERGVILQEILQTYDTPDDIIFDHFQGVLYPDQAYGRPVLGYKHVIESLTPDHMRQYMREHYHAENVILAISGNITEERAIALAEQYASRFERRSMEAKALSVTRGVGYFADVRDIEQTHVLYGCHGVTISDKDYYTSQVYATILGSGFSSRLFQEIREKLGLAYSVYASSVSTMQTGNFCVYSATSPEFVPELVVALRDQINAMAEYVSEEELQRAQAQISANILMSADSSYNVCEQMASHMMAFGRLISQDELVQKVCAIQVGDVLRYAQKICESQLSMCTVGSANYEHLYAQ